MFNKNNEQLPLEYINKIICGDSEEVLKNLPDNCIDLILTSPPYNYDMEYDEYQDDKSWEEYFRKLFNILDECVRVLKYSGRIIINIQPSYPKRMPSHHIVSNYLLNKKLIWRGEIIWDKNNYNCKCTAWGSWKSPSNPYIKSTYEYLEIFAKGTLKKEGKKENIDIKAEEFKQWVTAKWSITPETNMKKWGHPAMFPEELAIRSIKLFSYKEDIVLDPFNGAGTTTAVAKKLNRRYLGIDISEEYCKIAERRLLSSVHNYELF